MERRTVGIIGTIIAVMVCGFPGLFFLCWGSIAALVSFIPSAEINIFGSGEAQMSLFAGMTSLCLGIIFLAIPFVVGFFTLRKPSEKISVDVLDIDESLPPAI